MSDEMKKNVGSFLRLALGYLGGYLQAKGINIDLSGLEPLILAAFPVLAGFWAWWHNRKEAVGD